MKRVLFCLTSLSRTNGISKFIMSYYPKISESIKMDFLLSLDTIDNEYKSIIENNGGQIYIINCNNKFKKAIHTARMICDLNNDKQYDIIHINFVQQYALGCIIGAKKARIKKIIYHVHTPKIEKKYELTRNIINTLCINNSNCLVACSNNAGKSNYKNKKFSIIQNAQDFKQYKFSIKNRNKYIKEFKLNNRFVIGVVGRICEPKNPYGVLSILEEIVKINNNSILVWIGKSDKDYLQKFKDEIVKRNLSNNILLLGTRQDVNKIYSCFDVFLMPSIYEGLGNVFLEAQAAGLPTFASTNVSPEVKCTNLIIFYPFCNNAKEWANNILNYRKVKNREKYSEIMSNSNFSIDKNVTKLIQLYELD